MSRAVFIKGKRIDLVCLTQADAAELHRWNCDMELIHLWGNQPFPVGVKSIEEQIESQHKQKNSLMLGLQLKQGGTLIGIGGLSHIEWPWRRAEMSLAIGQDRYRGKGYGREATMLILDHAFAKLNLHSVMLRVISYNERAIKCYEACGFKLAGRRREYRPDGDEFHDVLFMDILSRELGNETNPTRSRGSIKVEMKVHSRTHQPNRTF